MDNEINYKSCHKGSATCKLPFRSSSSAAHSIPLILDFDYRFGLNDQSQGSTLSFNRPSAKSINFASGKLGLVDPNYPTFEPRALTLEGAATNYYCQPYTIVNSEIITDAPIFRTITLNTGSFVLWCKGSDQLSVSISAGTAVGSGWGVCYSGGYIVITITTSGTVNVTPSNSTQGDIVQLATGVFPTSFIPTPTTTPVSKASEGADTSGNGLSIPLSQAMVDSLRGELIDWSLAWSIWWESTPSGVRMTVDAANRRFGSPGGTFVTTNYYRSLSAMGISAGMTVEASFTVAGRTKGSVDIRACQAWHNVTANGTYIIRQTSAAPDIGFAVQMRDSFDGTVTINYCRRVLESGQTNRGDGTICQWVDIPWASSVVPNSTIIPITPTSDTNATRGAHVYRNPSGQFASARLVDGVNMASMPAGEIAAGRYCLISQWSAALGKMRAGLYNPATGALTWSRPTLAGATPYRGFFPIYGTDSQQCWRFLFGGGQLPVGFISTKMSNSILGDDKVMFLINETGI